MRRKGIRLIFLNRNADIVWEVCEHLSHVYGNVTEPEDVCGCSGESSLFLLTVGRENHGSCLTGDMV